MKKLRKAPPLSYCHQSWQFLNLYFCIVPFQRLSFPVPSSRCPSSINHIVFWKASPDGHQRTIGLENSFSKYQISTRVDKRWRKLGIGFPRNLAKWRWKDLASSSQVCLGWDRQVEAKCSLAVSSSSCPSSWGLHRATCISDLWQGHTKSSFLFQTTLLTTSSATLASLPTFARKEFKHQSLGWVALIWG